MRTRGIALLDESYHNGKGVKLGRQTVINFDFFNILTLLIAPNVRIVVSL